MKQIKSLSMWALALFMVLGVPQDRVTAEESEAKRSIRIIGRSEVTVTTDAVRLGDIAQVTSNHVKDNEALIALKKISLLSGAKPGKELSISAARVLERMREEGVDLKQIGYALPRMMKIQRAGRVISEPEVRSAIQAALDKSRRDASLKSISYKNDALVVPGIVSLEAQLFHTSRPAQLSAVITASVEGEESVQFTVPTTIEEWTQVPVANRAIQRGSVVQPSDVMMARLNISQIPTDAAREANAIVGLETSRNISYGEVFRKNKLSIPPVIESGARITLKYQSKFLEASASGVALESGIVGQKIRVRNDQSRKTIVGTVLEAGIVGVGP